MAPNPQSAAEMIILRLTYAADLPDPADLIKKLKDQPPTTSTPATMQRPANNAKSDGTTIQQDTGASLSAAAGPQAALPKTETAESFHAPHSITTMRDVVAVLELNGAMVLGTQVSMFAHPVKVEEGLIEFRPAENAPARLAQELSQALKAATEKRWIVTVSGQQGGLTIAQENDIAAEKLRAQVTEQPLVQNILKFFPDAHLEDIHKK
jgi:DNA polymerase-3 subunit gamma/tau